MKVTWRTFKIGTGGFIAGVLAELGILLVLLSFPFTNKWIMKMFFYERNIGTTITLWLYLAFGISLYMLSIIEWGENVTVREGAD